MLSPRSTGGRDPCIDGALDLGLWALCRPRLLVHAGSVHAGVPVLETGSSLPVPIFLTSKRSGSSSNCSAAYVPTSIQEPLRTLRIPNQWTVYDPI
jgi:hypothetical protein